MEWVGARYECKDNRSTTQPPKCMLADNGGADGLFDNLRACEIECEEPRVRAKWFIGRSAHEDTIDNINERNDSLLMNLEGSDAMLNCFVPSYQLPIELTVPSLVSMMQYNTQTREVWTRKLGADATDENKPAGVKSKEDLDIGMGFQPNSFDPKAPISDISTVTFGSAGMYNVVRDRSFFDLRLALRQYLALPAQVRAHVKIPSIFMYRRRLGRELEYQGDAASTINPPIRPYDVPADPRGTYRVGNKTGTYGRSQVHGQEPAEPRYSIGMDTHFYERMSNAMKKYKIGDIKPDDEEIEADEDSEDDSEDDSVEYFVEYYEGESDSEDDSAIDPMWTSNPSVMSQGMEKKVRLDQVHLPTVIFQTEKDADKIMRHCILHDFEDTARDYINSTVHNYDVNKDISGLSPLFLAAWLGRLSIVKMLIEAGANVNIVRAADGATPVFIAAEKGYTEIVEQLIIAGAATGVARVTDGATPLFAAVLNQFHESVDLLLSTPNPPLNIQQRDGATPIFAAADNADLLLVTKLLATKLLAHMPDLLLSVPLRRPGGLTGTTALGAALKGSIKSLHQDKKARFAKIAALLREEKAVFYYSMNRDTNHIVMQ